MQRTYGRRALQRKSGASPQTRDRHEPDDSPLKDRDPPSKPQPVRGSVVKRMLGRSRTESSLEATPLTETSPSSVQIIRHLSSHSLPATSPDRELEPAAEDSDQPSSKHIPNLNIRTYAGSSRSFLMALPVPTTDPSNAVGDVTEPHESYADLRARWGIDISEGDPQPLDGQATVTTPLKRNPSELSQSSLPIGMMNDLKSITELRSKGENRRFLDEVGYLFEGLDGSSDIGLRRASAFEIVSKLCGNEFNRRAKSSDFYVRTWNKLWAARDGTNDKIFDISIVLFAALAARDPRILLDVAQQQGFVPTLMEILNAINHKRDFLALVLSGSSDDDLRSDGLLRTEITALRSLAKLASKESHLASVSQPSARFFVSHSLSALPPSFLAAEYLPDFLIILRAELTLLEPRIAACESGLSMLLPTKMNGRHIPSFFHIEACLRLLDSYLLGHWSSTSPATGGSPIGLSHMSGFTSELMSLCVASSFLETEGNMDIARKCLCSAMRVLTLLSHDDPWWSEAALEVSYALPFVAMAVMRSQARWSESWSLESQKSSVELFDLLCLALGLVMNWATLNPEVRVLSRTKRINPKCPRSRLCVRACRCPDQKPILECFTSLHVQYSDNRRDDPPECAFLKGYTAILVGLLIKDEAPNQTIVLSTLPGPSHSDKIKSLIMQCNFFLGLYNDTTLPSSPDSPGDTPEGITPEATDCQRASWDKRGVDIARSVIASLETLRDN